MYTSKVEYMSAMSAKFQALKNSLVKVREIDVPTYGVYVPIYFNPAKFEAPIAEKLVITPDEDGRKRVQLLDETEILPTPNEAVAHNDLCELADYEISHKKVTIMDRIERLISRIGEMICDATDGPDAGTPEIVEYMNETENEAHPEWKSVVPVSEMVADVRTWVRDQLLFSNPWDLLSDRWNQIKLVPMADQALCILLADAHKYPAMEREMTVFLIEECRAMENAYELASTSKGDVRNIRPIDRARLFNRAFRQQFAEYQKIVGPTYRASLENEEIDPNAQLTDDLSLEIRNILEDQSYPMSEVENPDWIDAYSGIVEKIERVEVNGWKFKGNGDLEAIPEEVVADEMVDVRSYDEHGEAVTMKINHTQASSSESEAFNDDKDNSDGSPSELFYNEVGLEPEKDFQFSKDLQKSDEYGLLVYKMSNRLDHGVISNDLAVLRQTLGSVRQMVDFMIKQGWVTPEHRAITIQKRMQCKPIYRKFINEVSKLASVKYERYQRSETIKRIKAEIKAKAWTKLPRPVTLTESISEARLVEELGRVHKSDVVGASPIDLAYLMAEFYTDDCYPRSVLGQIEIYPTRGDVKDLGQFMDLWGDEIMAEIINQKLAKRDQPARIEQMDIEDFHASTLTAYVKQYADDPLNCKKGRAAAEAFAEAYFKVSFDAIALQGYEGKEKVDYQERAGFAAFRKVVSGDGEAAYQKARGEGKGQTEAMKTFWQVANHGVQVVKVKDTIVSIMADKTGVKLNTGRPITWRIAAMKVRGDELIWPEGWRENVKAKLIAAGLGSELVAVL